VRSRPPWSQVARKLTSHSPFPPHSNFPTPWGFPKSTAHPTMTTSRSSLHIVRNSYDWYTDKTYQGKMYWLQNISANKIFGSYLNIINFFIKNDSPCYLVSESTDYSLKRLCVTRLGLAPKLFVVQYL
jgi:hypothetical protein